MFNKTVIAIFITFICLSFVQKQVGARVGVGVGTGKIFVDENLRPGTIYQLPPVTVLNTGDEPSEYGIDVAYHQDQEQKRPPKEWFTFKPSRFHLEPSAAQKVDITLTLPVKAQPSAYFAYLEAFPVKGAQESGETQISIAAASKLYFSIAPANFFQGIYYRAHSFWMGNQPYTNIVLGVFLTIIILIIVKKNFKINVSVNKKREDEEEDV